MKIAGKRVRRRRLGVRQLAAALIPRACSRPSEPGVVPGQQAGLLESGSKLPHSKALRAFSCTVASRRLLNPLLATLCAMTPIVTASSESDQWKTFTSSKYHFSVEYPDSWFPSDATADILDITNFRRARPDESIALRAGGAEIQVAGARPDVHTAYDWIHHDLPDDATGADVHETDIPISKPAQGGCTKLTAVTWRERVAEGAYFAETSYYCQAGSGLYKVSLTNWDGDPKQKGLRELALKMALSLKAQSP
jgi:hypothetical protein